MTFQEIFNEKGLYRADGFAKGFCFEVNEDFHLNCLQYKDKDDLFPDRTQSFVYKGLFDKNFTKVLNRNQLFNFDEKNT